MLRHAVLMVGALVVAGAAGLGSQEGGGPAPAPSWAAKELRAGIIGTDTSHVPQFTKILHSRPEWKIRVVAAYKGGSPDLPISANRVEKFAETIRKDHGVALVDSIEALLQQVDVVLLTTVDGRPHLEQARPVFKAGKRVFIDKPLAASLEDARAIARLSRETGTPFFTASSVRFHPDIPKLREAAKGKGTQVRASYVLNKIEHHPDLYYYGIHGVEALYAVMGTGCERLSRKVVGDADVTTCAWKDGRTGVYHGLPKADSSVPLITITRGADTVTSSGSADSEALIRTIAEFFHTGRVPVDVEQSLEVFEFMTAAQLSHERNGAEIALADLRTGTR
jgi:hypothetical protein